MQEYWHNVVQIAGAQKCVTELYTGIVIFYQSHTNFIHFVIYKEVGQEIILSRLCFFVKRCCIYLSR